MPPSALFYNDTLEPCAQNGTIIWSELPNPKLPLAFFGHEYSEEWLDEVRDMVSMWGVKHKQLSGCNVV